MIFILLVAISALLWLIALVWIRDMEKLYKHMEIAAPRLPIFGHLYIFFFCNGEEKMKIIQHLGREAIDLGGISGLWLTYKLYLHVADPEVADIILKSCLEKDDLVKCFHLATGDGSIFTSVAKWRPRRKFLSPTFSMKNLNCFVNTFSKLSGLTGDDIKKEITAGRNTFETEDTYSNYSINAILESLGIVLNREGSLDHPFLINLKEAIPAISNRIFHPWLHSDFVFKLTSQYKTFKHHINLIFTMIYKVIDEKRKEIEETSSEDNSTSESKTFINLMIKSPTNVSDNAIREESLVILTAGTETTTIGLGFVSLMLARHPEEQENIYNEVRKVIGDLNRPITRDDLPHLKHLDAFIRETLRLYPPVPLLVRKVVESVELPSGIKVVPGCGTLINVWAINRNPVYWGADAEQFRPARFLETAERHPAAFATFSLGPRNCIGYQYAMMSMKTVVATIISQFRVEAASEELKHQPLRVEFDFMMRHVDNYKVTFKLR